MKKIIELIMLIIPTSVILIFSGCQHDLPPSISKLAIIETLPVSQITQTSANSGGNITSNGGASITARGVCWSKTPGPTISNSITLDGTGSGIFTSSITGLSLNTVYYIRAYATNKAGTAYGGQDSFITKLPIAVVSLPSLSTNAISSITETQAASGGNIINNGGAPIMASGICFNTSSNPTIANSTVANGATTGSFSSNLAGLASGTTYYVRAYATNTSGTGYGNEVIFKTLVHTRTIITVAGGNGIGYNSNQLISPLGIFVDANASVYVADSSDRIQKWTVGAISGISVAGGSNNSFSSSCVYVDINGKIYLGDNWHLNIQKWTPGAATGVIIAGGNGFGSAANQLSNPVGISADINGNIYVADFYNNRIQKWLPNATTGITVATAAGHVGGVFVDNNGNLYVTDVSNARIQKWSPGATSGVTVAGGNGIGAAANQFYSPNGVFVDANGSIYVADSYNNRIQKWLPNAITGITVAGGNGAGSAANQLNRPNGVFVDASGNIYVADKYNYRVQKWSL